MRAQLDQAGEASKFLRGISLFSTLDEKTLHLLAQASKFQRVEKGTVLFFQSDPSDSAYIVQRGNISIVLSSPDGRDMIINEMRAGDIFGELGILTRQPRSTSAIARAASDVLIIPREAFLRVVDAEPQLARRILELTAQRLQQSGEREGALAFMDAQARLARLLLELDRLEKETGYLTISQEELAHRTGLIRQTVAKVLGKWRQQGYLLTGRGRIVLLNQGALKEMSNQIII
jgi:CRP-like cAMP-binding protein